MKIIINKSFGGFNISKKALDLFYERIGTEITDLYVMDLRANPELISIVEELGKESYGAFSELKVIEIPDDIDYYISDYDGIESVHENHRIWN